MVDNSRIETMFPDGVDCLQSLEMETGLSRQMSYNDSINSTPWPKLRVSGADIKAKEIILVSMALMLLATSLCLFYKNWKKNYRDINQLPYYSYMYKIESPPPTVTRAPAKAPIMHWAKAAAAIGTQLTFSEPVQKSASNVDSLMPNKVINDTSVVHSHLTHQVPVGIRPRPPINQYSIPSVRINHRLQARLQRIRRLAAAEMERKAANEESNLSNHSMPVESKVSEYGSSSKSQPKNSHFRLQAKRAQSDVHLRLKSLDINNKSKHLGAYAYQAPEYKATTSYKHRLSNYAINEDPTPLTMGGKIKNSCSMSQCKSSGPINWKRDSCQIPLHREDRLGSLQPLPEHHGQDYDLQQNAYKEDTKDGLASRYKTYHEDDQVYYKNRSMSADIQNRISNQNIRSNSLGETQHYSDHMGICLPESRNSNVHNFLHSSEEQISEGMVDPEIVDGKVMSRETSYQTVKPIDMETREDDSFKAKDFSACPKQTFVSERFSLNGNSHTSTDV